MSPPFKYTRLVDNRFRLLKLRPGGWNDKVEVELFEADRSFHYIALSYTWGSPVAKKDIVVNGTVKRITVNLDLALRTLRSLDEPITLWADALCINQDDIDDKSQQVNLMHQIFSWATEVRAYIGPSVDKSQRNQESSLKLIAASAPFCFPEDASVAWEPIHNAISFLEFQEPVKLSPSERCLCIFGLLKALSCKELHMRLMSMDLFSSANSDKMGLKLLHLFEWLRLFVIAPWWDRMWITQEVGAARELSLVYGKVTVPFRMLSDVATELSIRPFTSLHSGREHTKVLELLVSKVKKVSELRRFERFQSITEIRDIDYFHRSLGSPLLWLLRTFRHRHSSEPRDKIYALSQLLAKLGTSSEPRFKTSYNIPVAVLFSRFAVRLMQDTGLFWITSPDLIAKSRDNLPSWVPNWADGFSAGELNDVAWKMRLCHNASNVTFTIKASSSTT
ncbi:heterokaryon incompatibility protein-domain-containing protein, partial [Mariannaea sp. PMI_226]